MSERTWNRRLATLALVGLGAVIGALVQDGWAQNAQPVNPNRTYDRIGRTTRMRRSMERAARK